jgi:hypothetical protein
MTDQEKWTRRALSRHQIATLRYIANRDVKIEHLEQAQQNTLGSLLIRKYIARLGDGIIVTKAGQDALTAYDKQDWAERKNAAPVTDRVAGLLKYAKALRGAA